MASSFTRFLKHTQRRTTISRTPLDEYQLFAETSTWRNTSLTTDRHPFPPVVFEPATPASQRPQTHSLNRAVTGIGGVHSLPLNIYITRECHTKCCDISQLTFDMLISSHCPLSNPFSAISSKIYLFHEHPNLPFSSSLQVMNVRISFGSSVAGRVSNLKAAKKNPS